MRVLYGVVGEGMGHATRSRVVMEYLADRGQDVLAVASSRAFGYLDRCFAGYGDRAQGRVRVREIRGLRLRYSEDGALDRTGTLTDNLLAAPGLLRMNYRAYADTVGAFRPDLVISDFDSFSYLFGRTHDVPVVSLDNIQFLARCKHPSVVKKGLKLDHQLTKAFVKAKLPKCDRYLVSTFAPAKLRNKCVGNTELVPPVLRASVVDAARSRRDGDHVLVYQTSSAGDELLRELTKHSKTHFVVYGFGRDERAGNLTLKSFRDAEFVDDLAQARSVVANGGYSLLSEAVYLHKPIYSVPVRHQYEQEQNARYVEHLGYGLAAKDLGRFGEFLAQERTFGRHLATYHQDGNQALYRALDRTMALISKKRSAPSLEGSEGAQAWAN
jgi:uncharacterized protein (TIGR00661 family)